MADWKQGGKPKKPGWRGDAAGPANNARHNWKSNTAKAPGSGLRKLAAALIGLLLVAVAGAIIVLWLLPTPPPKACLVLMSPNPAEQCTKLDVRMDLFGWQSAKFIAAQAKDRASKEQAGTWGTFAPNVALNTEGNPLPLPADEQGLADWANSLRNFDPLVIYVGAHTGSGPEGPFLFANGRTRLPVKSLLTTLATAPLRDKKKVLLLDPGRLPPSVLQGQLLDDFAVRMKALNKEISDCPNLLVMVGSSERAWESEELQATPLAIALSEALNGAESVSTDNDLITGLEVFNYVKKRVTEWTRENRPSASTPFLLPEGPEGESRAQAITVAVKPSVPAAAKSPVTTIDEAELERAWKRHDELAKGTPPPQAYSPRLWRRYRELLLRYEAAHRAGETATVKRLRTALDASDDAFKAQSLPPFESAVNSAALQMALGAKPADAAKIPAEWQNDSATAPPPSDAAIKLAILDRVLTRLRTDDKSSSDETRRRLAQALVLQQLYEPDQRPVEAHYAVMARDFYDRIGPKTAVPSDVLAAARLRSECELAAFGAGQNENAAIYPEVLGTRIKPLTLELDTLRRGAEDRLFASDAGVQSEARTALNNATDKLGKLSSNGHRAVLTLRDRVTADGPSTSEWLLAVRGDSTADELVKLWNGLHEAMTQLDGDDTQLATLFKSMAANAPDSWIALETKSANELRAAISAQDQNATLQGQWQPKQYLLTTPLIPAEQRMAILRASREISARLLAGGGKQTDRLLPGDTAAISIAHAVAQGRLALAMLGREVIDAQCGNNPALPKYDAIEAGLAKLSVENANSVGAMLAEHLRELAKPRPLAAVIDPLAERASRVSWTADADETLEPAAVNQRLRWRELLTALGERACADRWYDEREQPFFAKVADRYFRDAASVVSALSMPKVTDAETKRRTDLLANRKLQVTASPEKIAWTSELQRSVNFDLAVPEDYPATGQAVAIRDFTKSAPLKPRDAVQASERSLVELAPGSKAAFASALDIGQARRLTATCSTGGSVYFRGQRPTADLAISVMQRPELVLADPLPGSDDKSLGLAVRAAPDLDLGEIVIIVDYSGSMRSGLNGENYSAGDEYRTKPSKFRLALDALKPVLADLPFETRLKIRVFSDEAAKGDNNRLIYGDFERERTQWNRSSSKPLDDLMAQLNSLKPYSYTPLVSSIVAAATQDFSSDNSRTKTLVVLTDGIDEKDGVPNDKARMDRLSRELDSKFKDSDIQLLVVQFALTPSELELSNELFKSLPTNKNPGRVWSSADGDRLRENLRDALRPKLKLYDASRGNAPVGYPRSGWPSRLRDDGRDSREALYWSPATTVPDTHRLTATPYPSADRKERDLNVMQGDRLLLELAKVDGRTVVRRDLYADFFAEDRKKTRTDKQWVLTVPTTTVDDRREPLSLRGLAMLEKTPAHRVGGTEPPLLQQPRAEFLWWDVLPALEGGAKSPLGTVTIRKLYSYPAPAWDVQAEDWPRDGAKFASPRITAVVRDAAPPGKSITIPMGEAIQQHPLTGNDTVEVRPAIEMHDIGPDAQPISCLVVRIVYPPGKPVMVKLLSPTIAHNSKVQYFQKGNTCTAMFGPLTAEDFRAKSPTLELTPVPEADAGSSIALTLPRPTEGVRLEQDYKPQLAKPVDAKP